MRVLITGGSGFLGINLIRFLLNKQFEIISLDLSDFNYPEKSLIQSIKGDIKDPATVEQAMQTVDIVIHAAAALPGYSSDEIFSTDVGGTRNVIDTALNSGVKRFIQISSTAVYGIPDHHPLVEDDPLVGVGPYGKAKIEAEKICNEIRKQGMTVSILRPKSFIGPERLGVFSLLYGWASEGRNFPVIGKGENRYQLLDVEDLCEAIFLCMTLDAEIVNDVFNIGAGDYSCIKEDFQQVLDAAGFGKRIIAFPAWPVIQVLKLLEIFNLSPLYKWIYETASRDSFVSIEKAVKMLGYSPSFSNRNALLRNYEWYLSNIDSFRGKTGITHRVPWRQGALRLIKLFF